MKSASIVYSISGSCKVFGKLFSCIIVIANSVNSSEHPYSKGSFTYSRAKP